MKTLGSWYLGISVYKASALETPTVTEEHPNLPPTPMVLNKHTPVRVSDPEMTEINISRGAEEMN